MNNLNRKKILICDDLENICYALELILQDFYEVSHTISGKDALNILAVGNKFDLVILDKNMPGMSGFEVLSEIKSKYPLLKVVMISADISIEECAKLGAVGVIDKPFKKMELLGFIQKLLSY